MQIMMVRKTIKEFSMLSAGDSVVVAVSGGADSMVLLDILFALAPELSLTVVVAHLNHNLRGAESEADLEFVKAEAARLGSIFYSKTLKKGELNQHGISLQDAARRARYAFFEEAAKRYGAERVAVAHNMDDRAETILMRIIEGTGLKGLGSIPPVRGKYIRPIINLGRDDIEGYAKLHGVRFREDSSNKKIDYLRNRLRIELMPLIEKGYNPSLKATLTSLACRLSVDSDFIDGEAKKLYSSIVKDNGEGEITFPRLALTSAHPALASRLFFLAASALRERSGGIYATHAGAFMSLVTGERPSGSINLPHGLKVERVYDDIRLFFTDSTVEGVSELSSYDDEVTPLLVPGVTVLGASLSAPVTARIITGASGLPAPGECLRVVFDYDAIAGRALLVRGFRPGDRMRPLGLGGTKKLKEIFIDMKLPPVMRKTVPIVLVGDDIIWVAGLRRSEEFPVTVSTERVLELTIPADDDLYPEEV